MGGHIGICLPVLAGFGTLLHEPGGGLLDAVPPIERDQAPGEIRSANVGAFPVVRVRRISKTTRIARPSGGPTASFRGRRHRSGRLRLGEKSEGL